MMSLLVSEFLPWLIGAAGIAVAFLASFFMGKNSAKNKANKDKVKTHERILEADISDTPDDAREWLRKR